MRVRFVTVAGLIAALLTVGVALRGAGSAVAEPPSPRQAGDITYVTAEVAGRVDPKVLPMPAAPSRTAERKEIPLLTPAGPGKPPLAAPEAAHQDVAVDRSAAGQPPPNEPFLLTSFVGLDSTDNAAGVDPPDPQLAVGPDHIVEMVNVTGRIFDRSGGVLSTFSLPSFFNVLTGWSLSDPRVVYDAPSGRYFASCLSFIDNTFGFDHGRLHVAVSTTSNPLDPWNAYYIEFTNDLPDFPGLGLTDDKVTVSFNRFNINTDSYVGAETTVWQKSDLLAGIAPTVTKSTPNTSFFTIRPAHSLSSVTTQYMASVDFPSASVIHLWRVTGTPDAHNVVITNFANPSISTLSTPPNAEQAGSASLIQTNDNRLLEAVWRNGQMWVSANDACVPPGDTTRSCIRLIEVDTAASTVVQSVLFGTVGEYYYYPAIRADATGNLYAVFTRSSSSLFPEARFAGRLNTDPPGTLSPSVQLKAGEISHAPAGFTAPYRWGDYMGAALDPTYPFKAWVVGEYAKDDGFVEWGTYIGSAQFPFVGGVAEFPEIAGSSIGTSDSSSWDHLAPFVALASAVVVIGAGAWYARRRWLG